MASGLELFISEAARLDVFTYLIPWALVFTLTYYSTSNIWDDNAAIPVVLSLSFSSFVLYFLYLNPAYQLFFTRYSGSLAFAVAGIAGFLLLIGSVGVTSIPGGSTGTLALLFGVAGVAFVGAGGTEPFGSAVGSGGFEVGAGDAVSQFLFEQDGWIAIIPLSIIVAMVVTSVSDDQDRGLGAIIGEAIADGVANN